MLNFQFWSSAVKALTNIPTDALAAYAYSEPWLSGNTVLDQRPLLGTARPRQPGRCLSFNGTDQLININQVLDNGSDSFTVAVRFKTSDLSGVEYMAACGQSTSSLNQGWAVLVSGNLLGMRVSDGTNRAGISVELPSIGWHTFIARVDRASGSIDGYLNGSNLNIVAGGLGPSTDDLSSVGSLGTKQLTFAASTSAVNHLNGQLSDFSITKRIWTDEECEAYYQQGQTPDKVVSGVPNDQVLGYYLDENNFETVYNNGSLGNDYDGTIVNGASSMLIESEDVPWSPQNLIGFSEYLHPKSTEIYSVDGTSGNAANIKVKFYTPIEITKDTSITSLLYLSTVGSGSDDLIRLGGNTALLTDETIGVLQSGNRTGITANIPAGVNELEFDWNGSAYTILLNGVSQSLIHTNTNSNPAGLMPADMLELGEDDANRNLVTYLEVVVKDESDAVLYELSNPTEYLRTVPLKANDATQDVFSETAQHTDIVPNNWYLANSPCLTLNGVDDYISVPHLTGSETLTHDGTSTLTISSGRIDGTAGTVFDVTISDGTQFQCEEHVGDTLYDNSGNENHGTLITADQTAARAGTQDQNHANIVNGCDLAWNFDGTSYLTVNNTASTLASSIKLELRFGFRTEATTGTIYHRTNILFSLHNTTGGNLARIGVSGLNGGIFIGDEVVGTDLSYGSGYNDGKWHYAVLILEDGERPTLTIDGLSVSTSNTATVDLTTVARATFGQEWDTDTASDHYVGQLSKIEIYGDDVLIGKYCHKDESFNDESGNSNDGTNFGVSLVYLPAKGDGTSIIVGNVELPSGIGLNVSSAAIISDGIAAPENRGLTLPAEYRKGDGSSGDWIVGSSTDALDSRFTIQ